MVTILLFVLSLVGWVAVVVLSWRLDTARRRIAWYAASIKELQRRYVDAEEEVRHYREASKVENIHNAWLEAKKEEA